MSQRLNHPPPVRLHLEDVAQPEEVIRLQGVQTQRLNLKYDDPRLRRHDEQFAVLGFGGAYGDWDTLCITYGNNRLCLRNHPTFNDCLGPFLKPLVGLTTTVVNIPGKGRGLIATCNIPQGLPFIIERPLLICSVGMLDGTMVANFPMMLEKGLTPEHKKTYYQLHNCKPKEPGMVEAVSIMRTNGIGAQLPFDEHERQIAVYDNISRVNHSCIPNAY
ncbi:hypothetical protein DACRYDRAFT_106199 [Dacryopinax primogenitus]|uniref:SET domain-containing protein n=1 Tax=Dacryopinax primogenitus (strain DJM 731) TaxID=1858805 RepID=M5FY85_DACPD|nr:uncharacterized protein DACRYDRAFT_106199 [Dacryopinax primogenitus]EJU03021.1 hypothetical protein DACRYDRAFT_106199 [Dacryopinax primogenitus]